MKIYGCSLRVVLFYTSTIKNVNDFLGRYYVIQERCIIEDSIEREAVFQCNTFTACASCTRSRAPTLVLLGS